MIETILLRLARSEIPTTEYWLTSATFNVRAASIIWIGLAFPPVLAVIITRKGRVADVTWPGEWEGSCNCDKSENEECQGLHTSRLVVEESRKCW